MRKKLGIGLLLVMVLCTFTGCGQKAEATTEVEITESEITQTEVQTTEIIKDEEETTDASSTDANAAEINLLQNTNTPGEFIYAGLECVSIEDGSIYYIMKVFRDMQRTGKREGYCPLIILRDVSEYDGRSILDEALTFAANDYDSLDDYVEFILSEYQKIDADEFFQQNNALYDMTVEFDAELDAMWEAEMGEDYDFELEPGSQDQLTLDQDYDVYIAKVPTDKPYEVLAYVPVGGFNACPENEYQVAIAKKWYEEYGAVPCAVSYATIQYYLETPVTDEESLDNLKREQCIYCLDSVGSIELLKQLINGSPFWFFWWD